MLWSQRVIHRMTQVKRAAARSAPSRKQQRYSLMKIVGSLALIGGFVIFLLQSDPFPGVRKAAMRHRRQNENEMMDSPGKMQRDFRKPGQKGEKGEGTVVTGEIREEKKHEEANDSANANANANPNANANTNGDRIYTFELSNLIDGKKGEIVIQTKPEWAPIGVEHFHELLDDNFFKDAKFFRVVEDFIVQFGIPAIPANQRKNSIKDDPVTQTNARGTLTYATSGANTRTTQMFINTRKGGNKFLDGQGFSPIGVVIKGMDLVDEIYGGYKEKPGQGQIQNKGNTYLDKEFPLLSYISKTYQGNPE